MSLFSMQTLHAPIKIGDWRRSFILYLWHENGACITYFFIINIDYCIKEHPIDNMLLMHVTLEPFNQLT